MYNLDLTLTVSCGSHSKIVPFVIDVDHIIQCGELDSSSSDATISATIMAYVSCYDDIIYDSRPLYMQDIADAIKSRLNTKENTNEKN